MILAVIVRTKYKQLIFEESYQVNLPRKFNLQNLFFGWQETKKIESIFHLTYTNRQSVVSCLTSI